MKSWAMPPLSVPDRLHFLGVPQLALELSVLRDVARNGKQRDDLAFLVPERHGPGLDPAMRFRADR